MHQSCNCLPVPCIALHWFETLAIKKLWGCLHCKSIKYILSSRMTLGNKQQYILKQIPQLKCCQISFSYTSCHYYILGKKMLILRPKIAKSYFWRLTDITHPGPRYCTSIIYGVECISFLMAKATLNKENYSMGIML